MRFPTLYLLALCLVFGISAVAQLPEMDDPKTAPKNWQDDLRMMMRHGHMEPGLRDTLLKIHEFAKRGSLRRITKDHWYSTFSTSEGILAFRRGKSERPEGADHIFYDCIMIGIHASKKEPPPLPFHVETKIGGLRLLEREADVLRNIKPLNIYDETYFGEKCTAYESGAGHWIRRVYICNGRVVAMTFGLEP